MPLQPRCRYAAGIHDSLPVGDILTDEGVRHGEPWLRAATQPRSARLELVALS